MRRLAAAPRGEQRVLHLLAGVDLILKERSGERRVDVCRDGALFDIGEEGVLARRVGDVLVIDPFPARHGFREREALGGQCDQIGERGIVTIRDGGSGRQCKSSQKRKRA